MSVSRTPYNHALISLMTALRKRYTVQNVMEMLLVSLALGFGQCHGLWMFLDQTSFTKLCLLIQKLKNLLLLACWGKTHTGHYNSGNFILSLKSGKFEQRT